MVWVDKSKCSSKGYCWTNCSSVFMQDIDNKAKVIPGQEGSGAPCIQASQARCCTGAICIT